MELSLLCCYPETVSLMFKDLTIFCGPVAFSFSYEELLFCFRIVFPVNFVLISVVGSMDIAVFLA
jgi:hypothetical protein